MNASVISTIVAIVIITLLGSVVYSCQDARYKYCSKILRGPARDLGTDNRWLL